MEKKITLEEEKNANRIKGEFSEVHGKIFEIQKKMELLNLEAEDLIKKLETLREEESDFIISLSEKYGKGTLDPFNLTYKIENEIE
jgi:hypothetical protein